VICRLYSTDKQRNRAVENLIINTVMNIILQLPIIKVEMLNFKEIYNS